ncbi:MAG: hypothetical protein OEM81_09590 [Acidimicrobiia bacterium]|nr:hypothetical protein [Acidimicrobiia bacterium]MDH3398069.1 hypothetical protein [Acidimicrobiia bacterium]
MFFFAGLLVSCAGGAIRHEDGEGPLQALAGADEQLTLAIGGRPAGFAGTFGGVSLCLDEPGSATLTSVRPRTVTDGVAVLGFYVRVNDWAAGEEPIGTADGWPPDLADLEAIEGFTVTRQCGDTEPPTTTDLGFGLQKLDSRGGQIQDLEIAYTFAGVDYLLRTHVTAVICGEDTTEDCQ